MSPNRLRDCMILADMPVPELARRLGRPEAEVRRWIRGETAVPHEVATWLRVMARVGEEHPAPSPKRVRVMEPEGVRTRFW